MEHNFQRLALAFWETVNDLQTLRLIVDDTLEEISAEILRIDSLPVEGRKESVSERTTLFILRQNLTATRLNLSAFKTLCHARVDECSPGIFERMARDVIEAAARGERYAQSIESGA